MLSKFNISNSALLASSLLLTIGRGATLPFMAIYLTREYQMAIDIVGIAMSLAMVIGVLFSMGFGMLADRVDKKRCMLFAVLAFILGFIAIPTVNNAILVIAFFSLINCSYSVFSTVLKAYFADTLTVSLKAKIFSLNYTFINIGWTIGPPLVLGY
ncbi:putative transporter [Providencia rettgeri]|nr:putative transporter [Providencia rettgeri]